MLAVLLFLAGISKQLRGKNLNILDSAPLPWILFDKHFSFLDLNNSALKMARHKYPWLPCSFSPKVYTVFNLIILTT